MSKPRQVHAEADWPEAADPAAADRLVERFEAAPGRKPGRRLRAMLRVIGGGSPYLADLALREPATLRLAIARDPGAAVARTLAELRATSPTLPRPDIAARLRQAKRRVALATAVADIAGLWDVDAVTEALSALADAALRLAISHLLLGLADRGDIVVPDRDDPSRGSGFTVLGMGKLGARELNYSSDIDLVLLFDFEAQPPDLPLTATFTRLSRDLVALMEARDSDGYVFRTDLRLRPDPAATPPAVSIQAALIYYESLGQNWERAAMIKARPVAGDLALGTHFLEQIRPFVWRRHLDFAAIADMHAMKRRIDAHKDTALADGADPASRLLGHDVKLGEGGIREIEFLTQTLQLVWGGRNPRLREPRTVAALDLLAVTGHLPRETTARLAAAYAFLRRVEHRLQMVADRQTHRLPSAREAFEAFAVFMGFGGGDALAERLLSVLAVVGEAYAALFERDTSAPDQARLMVLPSDEPAARAALSGAGFARPDAVLDAVGTWRDGGPRALRHERSRALLDEILPVLLAALSRQPDPDLAFTRFEQFLARLPAGVQLLSMFRENPALLDRVALALGAAPSLADHLAAVPAALEGLLSPETIDEAPEASLRSQLRDARSLEVALLVTRRFVRGEEFRLSVAQLEGRIDADRAGEARAALADAAIARLLPFVMAEHARRYGRVPRGAMAIVALGKAGGREMMAGSDLDLMLIYDHPETVSESVGARPVAVSQYYIRAAHAVIAALTSPGPEGPLYAVDMRLRPSGNKGPVAVSLSGFRRYHAESAWTWERMALTRARVVGGPWRLRRVVGEAIGVALREGGGPAQVLADAASMRARMRRDLPARSPWDVKLRDGGLVDVEFIAQALQLAHLRERPEVAAQTTRVALRRLAGLALSPEEASLLVRADHVWRSVQGLLRIAVGPRPPDALPETALAALARVVAPAEGGIDLAGLRATLDVMAGRVHAAFNRLVGPDSVGETSL